MVWKSAKGRCFSYYCHILAFSFTFKRFMTRNTSSFLNRFLTSFEETIPTPATWLRYNRIFNNPNFVQTLFLPVLSKTPVAVPSIKNNSSAFCSKIIQNKLAVTNLSIFILFTVTNSIECHHFFGLPSHNKNHLRFRWLIKGSIPDCQLAWTNLNVCVRAVHSPKVNYKITVFDFNRVNVK